MDDHVYKTVELTGSSAEGLQTAIENAIAKAARSLHHLHWFQVTDTRGHIEGDKVAHWQVTLKVGFRID